MTIPDLCDGAQLQLDGVDRVPREQMVLTLCNVLHDLKRCAIPFYMSKHVPEMTDEELSRCVYRARRLVLEEDE